MPASFRVLTTVLLCVAASIASAQTGAPVHADVETIYRFQDGREVKVSGRYYRSTDGKVREESGSGSLITDIEARTMTMLNAERKQALVLEMPEPTLHLRRPASPPIEPFARGAHEGRAVEKTLRTAADGSKQEIWFAKDLGAVVYSRIEAPGLTTVRVLRNVKVEEPPLSVFQIPAEYVVTRQTLPPEREQTPPAMAPKPDGR